ncbi:phosphodiesterase [Mycolicibacter nonchromogenicus]|uniref:Phosphodiesterase n=1 Tax=Mycolicibacter nonchromogenicus TaxID=1782 RepID=A0A1X1ZF61_MYCNO|nr:phosphodiesterase [Mycolicibacter nonchromogenicus]ORW22047.1 phosphodiesterase [Mycolicibacter nonchromogenicus]
MTDPAGWPFRWGSALRHRRVFHPDGVLATGFLERDAPPDEGLPVPSAAVITRISKATGTPGRLPDAVGLAIQIPVPPYDHRSWDVLLVSAGSGVIGRAVGLRPVVSWSGLQMTTLMPLHYREQLWWLRARLTTRIDGYGLALSDIRRQLAGGHIRFEIDQACGTGEFRPLAHLVINGAGADRDVSFDPVMHTAPGVQLRPGWLAELRARAYRGSREGRAQAPATPPVAGPRGG